jgi:hypothetical protein
MTDWAFSDIQIFRHSRKAILLFMTSHKNCLQASYLLGPGLHLIKKEFTRPWSHKAWETLLYSITCNRIWHMSMCQARSFCKVHRKSSLRLMTKTVRGTEGVAVQLYAFPIYTLDLRHCSTACSIFIHRKKDPTPPWRVDCKDIHSVCWPHEQIHMCWKFNADSSIWTQNFNNWNTIISMHNIYEETHFFTKEHYRFDMNKFLKI